jgi:hypothetical protein
MLKLKTKVYRPVLPPRHTNIKKTYCLHHTIICKSSSFSIRPIFRRLSLPPPEQRQGKFYLNQTSISESCFFFIRSKLFILFLDLSAQNFGDLHRLYQTQLRKYLSLSEQHFGTSVSLFLDQNSGHVFSLFLSLSFRLKICSICTPDQQ